MKIIKKILIGIACLLGVVAIACGAIILNGTCFETYKVPKNNDAEIWMSKIDDSKRLNSIVIPGSHDSFTYKMPWLGATQNLNIEQQMKSGSRYFDIRVNKTEKDYVIYHGPFNGVSFDPIIDSIQSFISTHSTETLILDFQHFSNEAQDHVFEQVKEKLGNYVVKNETEMTDLEFIDQLTLGQCRGKCVVFFGYGEYKQESFIFERNNDDCTKQGCGLDSCYVTEKNSMSSKDFIKEALPYYVEKIEQKIEKEGHKGLFVLQGQLTDNLLIFGPYSREKSHSKNMSKYVNNLKSQEYFSLINIVMRDFVNLQKCSEIYNLNF